MAAAAPLEVAAAAAPAVDDFFPFAALPPALALKIFAALPADTRLRCTEVCKAWCAAVAERSLWTRLDLSETSGVTHRVTPALLRAAAAKARGALTALDISGVWQRLHANGVLRDVLAANAGTLRELRCLRGRGQIWMTVPFIEALLIAAPQLRVCEADVYVMNAAEARAALRNEGVFEQLRLRTANLNLFRADEVTHLLLFADVAAHASLVELVLLNPTFVAPAMLDAFVDAALSLPLLRTVSFSGCSLSPASVPVLARLLGSGTLSTISMHQARPFPYVALFDEPAAIVLGDALRANNTLTSLALAGICQVWSNHAAACALLGALTGHVSLREIRVGGDAYTALPPLAERLHAGALLGALIAADAPALTALDVSTSFLSDDGMRPLFEALPRNSHLRTLDCSYNGISDAFAADVLLPAVRANNSLHTLVAHVLERSADAAREAEELVKSRRASAAMTCGRAEPTE
jgi:hypothetical protein